MNNYSKAYLPYIFFTIYLILIAKLIRFIDQNHNQTDEKVNNVTAN